MALPNIEAHLGVSPPALVRKLTRKSHWGIASDPLPDRVEQAVEKVFPEQGGVFSVFRVESDADLRRIALAFNANRDSYTERLDLVAVTPAELAQCQINVETAVEPGTHCNHANRRHCHLSATHDQLRSLCETAMLAGRQAASLTTATMRNVVEAAKADGCLIVAGENAPPCACQRS